MIEALLALAITMIALGWIVWRVRRHKPRNRGRLIGVLVLMVLVMYAVNLGTGYNYRIQFWFGAITAILMAVATYVETEPRYPLQK